MIPLRVGTSNPGKLREFQAMLKPLGFDVRGIDDLGDLDIVEDGDSFRANAIIKAKTVMSLTGESTLADDSGLAVDALEGAPGIHSARYAKGEAWPGADQDAKNRAKLLAALEDVPEAKRTARFVCALAYCQPGEEPIVFEGTFEGSIGKSERGENGFGYDSIFVVQGESFTSAEMAPEAKNAVSHRAKALQELLGYLERV